MTSAWRNPIATILVAAILASAGCHRSRPAIVGHAEQEQAREAIERYRVRALNPARIPPPGVDPGPLEATAGSVTGTAALVRAEGAAWNRWGDDDLPLLFNDRVAILFDVDVRSEGRVLWRPRDTWLEVNTPDTRVPPVQSAEHLLAELNWNAIEQEKWVLDGDLVQRTRHAGAFREAFVRDGEALQGLIPFSLPDPEAHIGAMRLTVAVEVDGALHELVWTFQ